MRIAWRATTILTSILLACSRPDHEELLQQNLANLNALSEVLEQVTDRTSAERAIPRFEALLEEREELRLELVAAGDPGEKQGQALKRRYREQILNSTLRLCAAIDKVENDPEAGPVLASALEKLRDQFDRF